MILRTSQHSIHVNVSSRTFFLKILTNVRMIRYLTLPPPELYTLNATTRTKTWPWPYLDAFVPGFAGYARIRRRTTERVAFNDRSNLNFIYDQTRVFLTILSRLIYT